MGQAPGHRLVCVPDSRSHWIAVKHSAGPVVLSGTLRWLLVGFSSGLLNRGSQFLIGDIYISPIYIYIYI